MDEAWNKLNQRQQAYLTAIFTLDQAKKQEHDEHFRFYHVADGRPAHEWQQISYEEVLQEVCPSGEDVEQILAGLVQEGLIEREGHQGPAPDHPRIRITRAAQSFKTREFVTFPTPDNKLSKQQL